MVQRQSLTVLFGQLVGLYDHIAICHPFILLFLLRVPLRSLPVMIK